MPRRFASCSSPDVAVCHICGRTLTEVWAVATDVEYGTTAERFRYLRCSPCDALSIDPLPVGRLGEIYPSTYYSFASSGEALVADRNLVTRVKSWLDHRAFVRALSLAGAPKSPRVLDVGGGTGDISRRLIAAVPGARATVVDIDANSIQAAREHGLGGFAGGIEEFYTEERFDLILLLNLIEHVADPAAVLRRARDLLTPNGVVWVQTPNYDSLDARIFRDHSWTGLHCPRHWVVVGERGFRNLLHGAGLTPARVERGQAGSFWATSTLAVWRERRGQLAKASDAPLIASRAFMPLAAAGAAFDFATRRRRRTSQLVAFARLR